MKLFLSIITVIFLFFTPVLEAQQQPFIFTLYGGLFLPSNQQFRSHAQSSSDIIWGGGICLPFKSSLYAAGDISFFRAKAVVESQTDSSIELFERFIHVGIINKQILSGNVFIRLSGGLSYVSIKQTTSSFRTPEKSIEADKKLGYYGGIGLEQPLDEEGHLSIFGDVVYDYRRSQQKQLYGDFGGIRIVFGVHLFMF
jgi:hypothetical protein